MTTDDIVEPAVVAEQMFHASSLAPSTGATLRTLADLQPTTLAVMHGGSFTGDGGRALRDLATAYDEMITTAAA